MKTHRIGSLIIFLMISVAGGCVRNASFETIDLPPTPVLTAKVSWGVVRGSYLRMREAPKPDAPVVAPLHKMSVVEILSKNSLPEQVDDVSDYWYQVNYEGVRGWVFGSNLNLYDSREKAENSIRERK